MFLTLLVMRMERLRRNARDVGQLGVASVDVDHRLYAANFVFELAFPIPRSI